MTVKVYNLQRLGSEGVTHVLCSSGCGIRSGAPLISHAKEGPFQLMGIAVGGAPCIRRSMRRRLNREPPLYIDVYPYVTWIINYITAFVLPRPYPENFMLMESGSSTFAGCLYIMYVFVVASALDSFRQWFIVWLHTKSSEVNSHSGKIILWS